MTDSRPTIQQLQELLQEGAWFTYENFAYKGHHGYPDGFAPDHLAWNVRMRNVMHRTFANDSAPVRLVDSGLGARVMGNGVAKFVQMKGAILSALSEGIRILQDDRFGERAPEAVPVADGSVSPSNRVFVVHGHDEAAKASLELFLQELGLEPVVLYRQADEGRTIIEKFEHYSDVGYAFVLLTPDEVAYVADQDQLADSERAKEFRARPNVIFEFGFFVGRLGRSRVCCLYRSPVTLPSDVSGLLYKRFERSVEEVGYAVIKELRAVGYNARI